MYKTRLVSSLQTLSKKELQQFQLFVSSPFYNKNTRLITFIDSLIPYAPDFVSSKIERNQIYAKLFPNQAFDEQKLRLETSSLFQLLKEYLSTISYQNDPYQKQAYLLEELRQRNNERVFQSELKAWENNLEKSDQLNSQKYFAQYRLYAEKNVFFGQQFLRKYNPSLQNKVDNFDLYFLTIKLKETCEMLNRQAFIKPGYEIRMADELINVLSKDSFYLETSPLIAVYYKIYQMLTEPDKPKHFQELTDLLALHHHKFEKHESRGIYKQAQNYCIRQINREQQHYLSEIFNLYQQQLESQLIMFEGNISPTDFKNIVTVGLRLKKFPWVESFLLEYGPKIHSEHRESIFNFNMANFLVSSGKEKLPLSSYKP